MTISAQVICDSISPGNIRLTTLVCKYPRFIHSETLTHRMHSRNSASSRAIPVERMIEQILSDTAMPIHWGLNQKGMQAEVESSPEMKQRAINAWLGARDEAIEKARWFSSAGFHKQIVNRLLEPFMHMSVVLTATEWENYFSLRCHKDAQPEFKELATQVRSAISESSPKRVNVGEWHIPFIREYEKDLDIKTRLKISSARCARVSYLLHNNTMSTTEKDIALCDRLAGSRPIHASPFEHQATPSLDDSFTRNFKGWIQQRVFIEGRKNERVP